MSNVIQNNFTKKFPIIFNHPVELLYFYDPAFRDGEQNLYPWQAQELVDFSRHREIGRLNQNAVVAANGSGKSQFILAPCIAWLAMSFDDSLAYVTSASAAQLDTQTERFLDYLIDRVNVTHKEDLGTEVFERVKRKKRFLPTNSYVDLLATDEAGRAEGKHPLRPNAEFGVFIDEGKSIQSFIYEALARCTNWTRKLYVSSPGGHSGEFYQVCTTPELGWNVRKVTYKDCPHIREEEVKNAILKHGINDPLVRSMYFAEFTADDSTIVISKQMLDNCIRYFTSEKKDGYNRAGLDLAAGGDENVISIWNGNVMIEQRAFRSYDTNITVRNVIDICNEFEIKAKYVWADDGGVGRGILDNFADKGWNFNRVIFGGTAFDKTRYLNRGTELWFNFKQFVENNSMRILPDSMLKSQLSNRYYRLNNNSKIMLEPKAEAKLKGHPSPDRADAAVLAWADRVFEDELIKDRKVVPVERKKTPEEVIDEIDKITYGEIKKKEQKKPVYDFGRSSLLLAREKFKGREKIFK